MLPLLDLLQIETTECDVNIEKESNIFAESKSLISFATNDMKNCLIV